MARRKSKFLMQQQVALGLFGIVALGIVGYLSWLALQGQQVDEFVEGEHYFVVENPRRVRGDSIEVMEFFSYACVHCYNFDPIIKAWAENHGDQVTLVQTPAVANEFWRMLGRVYYTLDEMDALDQGHMAYFRAIHDARLNLSNEDAVLSFAERAGLDRDEFEQAYRSPQVNSRLNRADQLARRLRVAAVPTVVVQGKYIVRTSRAIGPRRMLDVIDYLVQKEAGSQDSGDSPDQPA